MKKKPKMDKGTNCAYCGNYTNPYTRDHVIANAFYFPDIIQNTIVVPACKSCNSGKSNEEDYMAIVMRLASGLDLTEKQERGIKRFSKKRRELFLNAKRKWIKIDGIYQEMATPEIDFTAFDKVLYYMAMGLVYEFCGKNPVMEKFPHKTISWMPISEEKSINDILSLNAEPPFEKFLDSGRFNDKVKYGIVAYDRSRIIVYLQFLNPLMFLSNKKQSRVGAVSFLTNETMAADIARQSKSNDAIQELVELSEELNLYNRDF